MCACVYMWLYVCWWYDAKYNNQIQIEVMIEKTLREAGLTGCFAVWSIGERFICLVGCSFQRLLVFRLIVCALAVMDVQCKCKGILALCIWVCVIGHDASFFVSELVAFMGLAIVRFYSNRERMPNVSLRVSAERLHLPRISNHAEILPLVAVV